MKKYMIHEAAQVDSNPIITKRHKDYIEFTACLQEAEIRNRNRRKYPFKVLDEGIKAPYIKERLNTKSLYGECGHPLDQDPRRQMYIDQTRISHIIKEVWWDNNLLKGKIETANTSAGRDLRGLIEQGSIPAFSLRAQGAVVRDSEGWVVKGPIQILCWDWVINPSHDKAFLESISESTRNLMFNDLNNSILLTEAEEMFEIGSLKEIDEPVILETVDYAQYSNKKYKNKDQVYIFDRNAERKISDNNIFVETLDVNKKSIVTLNDYLIKDIRDKFSKMGE